MTEEISNADKITLVDQKILLYRRTHYDAKLDAQIGQDLGNEQLINQAKERMKAALKTIDILEEIRAELVKGTEEVRP